MANKTLPKSSKDILTWVEEGKISAGEALAMFKPSSLPKEKQAIVVEREQALEQLFQELNKLVGLSSVKQLVKEIQAFVEIQQRRLALQLVSQPVVLHQIFMGNPGTGKTTVARIIGKMFKEMGVLSKGHLVEVERADLVAEYIGQTAQRTRDNLKKAAGGILFIDEAYSLARGGEKDFGKEAIDTLVKTMEDRRSDLIVILAGYSDPMKEFLQTNPGLRSRFPITIEFPDYTSYELFQIAESMLDDRQYNLNKEARRKLFRLIDRTKNDSKENFGNARVVRNMIEKAIRRQAVRLVHKSEFTRDDLMEIAPQDIGEVLAE